MKHAEATEQQVGDLLRRRYTVSEVAGHMGLPERTIRGMAQRLEIEPASAKASAAESISEGMKADLVAIVADARAMLANLSEKIRVAPAGDAPKLASAYATVLKSLAGLGIATTAESVDRAIEQESHADEEVLAALDFGMERAGDDGSEDYADEDLEDVGRDETPTNRERLIKMHTERAMRDEDPVKRLARLGLAVGPQPSPSPGDVIREREQLGPGGLEEEQRRMILEAAADAGAPDE